MRTKPWITTNLWLCDFVTDLCFTMKQPSLSHQWTIRTTFNKQPSRAVGGFPLGWGHWSESRVKLQVYSQCFNQRYQNLGVQWFSPSFVAQGVLSWRQHGCTQHVTRQYLVGVVVYRWYLVGIHSCLSWLSSIITQPINHNKGLVIHGFGILNRYPP